MKALRILLAEDNQADVLLVREALAEHHIAHELSVVEDGEAALDFLRRMGAGRHEACPDLMLLDLNLPKADGATVLKAFREHPECIDTPVIVVTSSDSPRDRTRVAELGISAYFRKPSDFDSYIQLGAVIRDVVGGRTAS